MAQDILVTTHFGGALGKRFGTSWPLYLSKPSPAEALHAININTGGELYRYLKGPGAKRYYKVALGRRDNTLEKDELANPSGQSDIYILPTVKGAKEGWQKIVVGVILAVVTYGASVYIGAAGTAFASAGAGTIGYGMAASLILGGITQMLTPVPNFDAGGGSQDGRGSNLFQGNAAAIAQGGCVPIVYGRALVAPMPISLAFNTQDQSIVNSFAPTEYEVEEGPGGVINYVPVAPDADANLP